MNPYDILSEPGHEGKFTAQFKARKPHLRHLKSLEEFAHYILANPTEFNKISKQRANFYKNLIERKGGMSLRGGSIFSVVELLTQAYIHKNDILEAQVYFAIIDFILKTLLSWLNNESPTRLDRLEPLPIPTKYPNTLKDKLDVIKKIGIWAANNNFGIPHNIYLNILKEISKISVNVGKFIHNKLFPPTEERNTNTGLQMTDRRAHDIELQMPDTDIESQMPDTDIESQTSINNPLNSPFTGFTGNGRLTKKMMKDLRAYHRQVGGKISTKDFNLMLKETYKKPQDRDKHIGDYYIDESLSTPENVVYHNPKTGETKVAYRGTEGTLKDWGNNALYAFGLHNTSKRYKRANETQKKVEQKYGTQNLDVLGHSQSGAFSQEIGKNAKNVVVLNPASHPLYSPKTKNTTVVRSKGDSVSALKYLNPLNWGKKADVEIEAKTYNPIEEHMPSVLERLPEDQMLGEGRKRKRVKRNKNLRRLCNCGMCAYCR